MKQNKTKIYPKIFFFKAIGEVISETKAFLSSSAIGSDGLCCQSREVKEWHGCRATRGVTKGKDKMYFRGFPVNFS